MRGCSNICVKVCISLFVVILLCRCREPIVFTPEQELFLSFTELGIYRDNRAIITYRPPENQFSANKKRRIFRIQTDDQQQYFHVQLTENTPKERQIVEVYYKYLKDGQEESTICKMRVLKVDYNTIWLWPQEGEYSIIMVEP